ncbi:hypothetical protein PSU4_03630 [Pseudonocardia sulfidoxydans NBRC 16205]|uniref:Histidine kinase/HSP90-like ATPase domain-containing protein n=1 Tax=Pseudonocardia sulfidoxydans NBRC 16205 TaxID=1223511 RepID=A0A511D9C4_9PSEU|nr:hypothetical protein PSU4_03630 [Pseudonocardia sulfidoxydans NBRC 16205]
MPPGVTYTPPGDTDVWRCHVLATPDEEHCVDRATDTTLFGAQFGAHGVDATGAAGSGKVRIPVGDTVDEQERVVPLRAVADPAPAPAPRNDPATELALEIVSDPARLAPMRRAVVAWARALDLTEDTVADLQLAVGEAAANGVEHAYPADSTGLVEVTLRLRRRRGRRVVAVRVSDQGRWRRPPADPGYRGRGIAMIRAVAHDVAITPGRRGTEVTFSLPA